MNKNVKSIIISNQKYQPNNICDCKTRPQHNYGTVEVFFLPFSLSNGTTKNWPSSSCFRQIWMVGFDNRRFFFVGQWTDHFLCFTPFLLLSTSKTNKIVATIISLPAMCTLFFCVSILLNLFCKHTKTTEKTFLDFVRKSNKNQPSDCILCIIPLVIKSHFTILFTWDFSEFINFI